MLGPWASETVCQQKCPHLVCLGCCKHCKSLGPSLIYSIQNQPPLGATVATTKGRNYLGKKYRRFRDSEKLLQAKKPLDLSDPLHFCPRNKKDIKMQFTTNIKCWHSFHRISYRIRSHDLPQMNSDQAAPREHAAVKEVQLIAFGSSRRDFISFTGKQNKSLSDCWINNT